MEEPPDITRGRHQYYTPTGLIVLFDAPRQPMVGEGWSWSPGGLTFPTTPGPSLTDQMVVVCDEAALGLTPPSTLAELRELVSYLPYVPAAIITARIATLLWPVRDEPEAQFGLAKDVFGDAGIIDDFRAFLDSGPGPKRYLFHEQQLFVLLRLILEDGAEWDETTPWTTDETLKLRKALVQVTSVVQSGSSKFRQSARAPADWLGFLTQNSAYNATDEPLLAYQRAWRIYAELATDVEAKAHDAYCDLEAWHQQHLRMTLEELLAVGHSVAYRAQSAPLPVEQRGLAPPMKTYLGDTKLAERHAAVTDAFSAPRSFYVDGFKVSRENELRLAWETTPFMTEPFLRLPDDSFCLTSPRALQSFLTDGIYYRFLDIAAAEGRRDDYTTFVGWLVERYVVELFEQGMGERPAGQGCVHGEQVYARGGQKTSDVAVDCGDDLVLAEVISTRLPLGVRAEGDEAVLDEYLKRTITDKLGQLNRVIDDLLAGRARIPDVDASAERIWPVLVTHGDLLPAEPLFAYIANATSALFGQSGVRPLTLLGLEDVEMLMGMVAAGSNLVDVLREKSTGAYASLPFSRWLTDTHDPLPSRLPELEQRWWDSTNAIARVIESGK
jgi:hypothetical protein